GRMAKAERKNIVCPTGYFSPRKRTNADITASRNADTSLSRIARRTFNAFKQSSAAGLWSFWTLNRRKRLDVDRDGVAIGIGKLRRVAHHLGHRSPDRIAVGRLAVLKDARDIPLRVVT